MRSNSIFSKTGPSVGTLAFAFAALLAATYGAPPVLAQQARPQQQQGEAQRGQGEQGARRPQGDSPFRLPGDSVTDHTLEFSGRTLHFKATAGSITLSDAESGSLQAEIAYISYVLADSPLAGR